MVQSWAPKVRVGEEFSRLKYIGGIVIRHLLKKHWEKIWHSIP